MGFAGSTLLLLAAGLDPEMCVLHRQSDVQEHTELCWLLSAVTAHGDLNRMHQFKDKSAQQRELVGMAQERAYAVADQPDRRLEARDEQPHRVRDELRRRQAVPVLLRADHVGEHVVAQVAAAVRDVCAARGCDLVIYLGDNIYETGAESAADTPLRRR